MSEQRILEGLSDRELLECMLPDDLVDHILKLGEKVTKIENDMNLASEVLEGGYGITVEDVLARRDGEKKNGEQK